jgi:3-deoxy-D-manno-octulosonic-acid transferase
MRIYLLLYNLFISLYRTGIRIASIWNEKAALWISGRRMQANEINALPINNRKVTWMHCASLGEFEQGRPLLEALRSEFPGHFYLVTFFSPSGFEVQKNYAGADKVLYLPTPTAKNARDFIGALKPSLVIWVKYEYWYHYLHGLHLAGVPVLLVSAIFRDRQPFFKWYGKLHRQMLQYFEHVFVQDQTSGEALKQLNKRLSFTVSGDTRFDRVVQIAEAGEPLPLIEAFRGDHPLIVAGSTWQDDEEELDHYCNTRQGLKTVLAPHHIDEAHLLDIEKLFKRTIRFSRLKMLSEDQFSNYDVLIIDNIGMLSRMYRYATICYIGGGFGDDGVHNVLEAAVYGKPVIHGPEYDKYREAIELVECGGAFPVDTALELEAKCNQLLLDEKLYADACAASLKYVRSNSGATRIILNYIREKIATRKNVASPVDKNDA